MSQAGNTNAPNRRIIITASAVVFTVSASALLIFWLPGLPGPHHGDYRVFAKLMNIRNALWSYNHQQGHLPPATAVDVESGESSSWRVEVCQYYVRSRGRGLGESVRQSSIEYDYRKPWNDPDNLRLQSLGARFFEYEPCRDRHSQRSFSTYFKAVTGPETAFDSGVKRNLEELPNDLILVVRVEYSDTHWMEPGDLSVNDLVTSQRGQQLLIDNNGCAVLFADGKVWILSSRLPLSHLYRFFTMDGATEFDRVEVLGPFRVDPF